MSWIAVVTYGSIAVFCAAVAVRFVKYKMLPAHLRWELYPVAHEKGRSHYGGSYLEEMEWWTKPRKRSLLSELKVMLAEIFLLWGVREHNKGHWYRSLPFHLGLYLLCALIVLLAVGAALQWAGVRVAADGDVLGAGIYHLTYVVGWSALLLGLIGAATLLILRTHNEAYRDFTKPIDYFNLVFFLTTFTVALAAHATGDMDFARLRAYVQSLMQLDLRFHGDPFQAAESLLGTLLVAYIPLTHMSHFFTKWFVYHDIRWNDEPLRPGSRLEERIERALHYPVHWAAPHIRGGGTKNWLEVAASGVEEER